MIVEDVMTQNVITVSPLTPLRDVAHLLAEHEISGLPVVDDGLVVGVISETDLLADGLHADEEPSGRFARFFSSSEDPSERHGLSGTAADVMTTPAVTIAGREPLEAAVAIMAGRDVNRLPVVDGRGLAGIVARADVVRALARSDEEIHTDVIRELRAHWISPECMTVDVDNGDVHITGEVKMPKAAQTLIPAIEAIPGVVSVRSEVVQGEYSVERPGFARRTKSRLSGSSRPN